MVTFIRENILEMDDVSQVLARLMKYPPVESIMVIIDKALMIAGSTTAPPSMTYGHLPRRDKPLPPSLPSPPQEPSSPPAVVPQEESEVSAESDEDPLSAIAETVVKGTRGLFAAASEDSAKPTPASKPASVTGFTPRPGYSEDDMFSQQTSNSALSAFESPTSNHSEPFGGAEGFGLSDGGSTHRKMANSFGPGVDGTESPVFMTPSEVVEPIEPGLARKNMIHLVREHEAPRQAMEFFDGAINFKDEQVRDQNRALAERLDECAQTLQDYLSSTQMFAEDGEEGNAALPAATEAIAQLEVIRSCLILGGDLPAKPGKEN
jgi:hypothetical protein